MIDRINNLRIQTVFFISSVIYSILISVNIASNRYSHLLVVFWFLSILLLILSFSSKLKFNFPSAKPSAKLLFCLFFILLPSFVRIANYNVNRLHGDDALTAYFSANYDFAKTNFFSGIPSAEGQWVAQFPTIFFILQKFFFLIFGESYLTIKLSVIPYVLIVSIMLYLITQRLINERVAIISLIIYAFLPISIYLETLGLHFVSSTSIFLIFFYLGTWNLKENTPFLSVLTGVSAGFCFLFYSTSYIALPFLIIFFILQLFRFSRLLVLRNFLLLITAFMITVGPFFTYAITYNNYFLSRINQVSLLTGSWSEMNNLFKQGQNITTILREQTLLSVQSLYINNIGGHGGYYFGHLALFNNISLSLLVIGAVMSLILTYRKIDFFLIISVIVISFISGVILTIPPPAFHRFSLAFPFISIVSSVPFHILFCLKKIKRVVQYAIAIVLIGAYILFNELYFLQSVGDENYNINIKIANYINTNYPGRKIYVAAYGSFSFMKIYYFSPGKNAKSITSDYHDNFIQKFNPNEKYVYIITFPKDFDKKFSDLDPNGQLIKFSNNYSLLVN